MEWMYDMAIMTTLPETNSSRLKMGHLKRKLVFQPSIFRRYVSFREHMFDGMFGSVGFPKSSMDPEA